MLWKHIHISISIFNILIPQCFLKGNHLFLSIETYHQLLFSAAAENTELALPWLYCEWVDTVKLLMFQYICWSIFLVLLLFFFPLGFLLNCVQMILVHNYSWKTHLFIPIALKESTICCFHTHTYCKDRISDKLNPILVICILSKWLILSWLGKRRRK